MSRRDSNRLSGGATPSALEALANAMKKGSSGLAGQSARGAATANEAGQSAHRAATANQTAALSALAAARQTPNEARAIDLVRSARARGHVDEPLVVAAARLLAERGDTEEALQWLADASSAPALLVLADLLADGGRLGEALSVVERVLAREIAAPGAFSRHRTWSRWLGREGPRTVPDEPTLLGAEPADRHYRIIAEAGRGGAGTVYEAFDDALGRRVAYKAYHDARADRAKLVREARVAVALAGPGVIRVYDADAERGWIAMEWASRGALRTWLRRGEVSALGSIESWWWPLLAAVGRVHAAGLVHGDIKPANVLLRSDGTPLLADFGSAAAPGVGQSARRAAPANEAGQSARMGGARNTWDGGHPGSIGYLSPERLAGEPVTSADDVYGLGRILEDVLEKLGETPETEPWWRVARCATGPAPSRPATVRALMKGQEPPG